MPKLYAAVAHICRLVHIPDGYRALPRGHSIQQLINDQAAELPGSRLKRQS